LLSEEEGRGRIHTHPGLRRGYSSLDDDDDDDGGGGGSQVINKTDLAEAVGADLDRMKKEANMMRGDGPVVMAQVRRDVVEEKMITNYHEEEDDALGMTWTPTVADEQEEEEEEEEDLLPKVTPVTMIDNAHDQQVKFDHGVGEIKKLILDAYKAAVTSKTAKGKEVEEPPTKKQRAPEPHLERITDAILTE